MSHTEHAPHYVQRANEHDGRFQYFRRPRAHTGNDQYYCADRSKHSRLRTRVQNTVRLQPENEIERELPEVADFN